jgi:hypothetical protein
MNGQLPRDEEGQMAEEVELVSSGYAWRCPECMRTEYENSVPSSGKVSCTRCGASFPVREVSHRVEAGALDNAKVVAEGELRAASRPDD